MSVKYEKTERVTNVKTTRCRPSLNTIGMAKPTVIPNNGAGACWRPETQFASRASWDQPGLAATIPRRNQSLEHLPTLISKLCEGSNLTPNTHKQVRIFGPRGGGGRVVLHVASIQPLRYFVNFSGLFTLIFGI